MITLQSPIVGVTNVPYENTLDLKKIKRLADVTEYMRELVRLCELVGFNWQILFAQAAHETANFTSRWWVERLNPAGIGITGTPAQDEASHTWANGTDAARAHVIHLIAYVYGDDWAVETWHQSLVPFTPFDQYDPRFDAVFDAGFAGTVKVLGDLGSGKWATDKDYATKIVAKANLIFRDQEEPMPITYGNVKHPVFVNKMIPNTQTAAFDDLGPRRALGVCQHSMIGTLNGTDQWFRRGPGVANGLTDYGIGGSTDGALDGVIYKWNDPKGRRSGWANGGSDGLEGDGPLFVRTLGINAINRDLVSIERSDGGNINTPMSAKQFESICQLTAYWFDQAKVPWDKFPLNPAFAIVTHFLHFEFATKACAFPPVNGRINEIQDRVRAIMKSGQTKVVEPTTPPVKPPQPDHDKWPYPVDELRERFGMYQELDVNGKVRERRFQSDDGLANAWAARAVADKIKSVKDIPRPLRGFDVLDAERNVQSVVMFDQPGQKVWLWMVPAKGAVGKWVS